LLLVDQKRRYQVAITSRTNICGLIGDPVEHSMSPAMQNAAFSNLGLDYVYVAFKVRSEDVGNAIAAMRALNIRGLNVTIPHKLAVIPHLDRMDGLAAKIGAVNTIVNDGGILTGFNTDSSGFIRPLLERGFALEGKRALIIGAGGAARAAAFALMDSGASLYIINRTVERARTLAGQLESSLGTAVTYGILNEDNLGQEIALSDMVVNTTSVGMSPSSSASPVPVSILRKGLIVYDIVYNPVRTRLVQEAESAGCVAIGGAEMLAWQGALAFEKWTGRTPPIGLMKEVLLQQLGHEK
jgi:shikimate dehydrogenase